MALTKKSTREIIMKKIIYVGFKFSHMGPHAGYDIIKNHAGYDIILDCQSDYSFQQKIYAKKNLISKIHGRLFGGYMWWIELRCLLLSLFNRNLVFHFIYAENTYRYLGLFKWLGFKIVCTYHQPASFFKSNPEYLLGIRFVDDVIVLSEEARSIFTEKINPPNVHYLPHGVDCEYFKPGENTQKKKELLMVGNWLRNFKFASEVFDRLLIIDPEVTIHVVTLKENHNYFNKHPRLYLYTDISDEDLLHRYQSASLLFLPLHGFVANNAVLEMSAVGSSVLIASHQKPDIKLENLVEHVPLDLDIAVSHIINTLKNSHNKSTNNKQKRDRVLENYSWPLIGKKTKSILLTGR